MKRRYFAAVLMLAILLSGCGNAVSGTIETKPEVNKTPESTVIPAEREMPVSMGRLEGGTYINDWMRLHPEQAQRLSPLFHLPDPQLPVLLAVGGLETDGFKNQTAAYESACRANGNTVEIIDTPNNNHFDLVCELADGQAALTQSVFSMILGVQTQHAASQQQVATSAG